MGKRTIAIATLLALGPCVQTYAWHSVWPADVHRQISNDALSNYNLDAATFPDLHKFATQLADGSNTESHNSQIKRTGNNDTLDGGYPQTWWNLGTLEDEATQDNALGYYEKFQFSQAYTYIGRMIHLIQDQAVPPHAANILHGWFDNFELSADSHYSSNSVDPINQGNVPYLNYQSLQTDTRQQFSSWVHPTLNRQYWYPTQNAPSLDSDATWGAHGFYGGDGGSDIYDWSLNAGILTRQLTNTRGYTEGTLIAASKLLPPLVKEPLKISDPVINTQTGNSITFKVIENRTANVKISLLVDGVAIKDAFGNVWDKRQEDLFSDSDLPYGRTFGINWKGEMSSGELEDGQHTLQLKVWDTEDSPNQAPDLDNDGDGVLDTQTDFKPFLAFLSVGSHKSFIFQNIIANSLKSAPGALAISQDRKRRTASYARRVALCRPLARPASAPQARADRMIATHDGEKDLLCGVRRAAASRYAGAPRTAWYGETYPRDAAGSPIRRPIGGAATGSLRLPQVARVAVGGRTSGGQLPRSPEFFSPARPAEKIQKRIFAEFSAKAIKRILPGATARDVGGIYG